MTQFKDGGLAFPVSDPQRAHDVAAAAIEGVEDSAERDRLYIAARSRAVQGMTLRDYFAAHAPITLADAKNDWYEKNGRYSISKPTMTDFITTLAQLRGEYADMMIAERGAQ